MSSTVIWFYLAATPQGKEFITLLANKLVNDYITEHAEIGSVELQFPPRISISNLVIYDHRDSVLLKVEALRLNPVWPPLVDSVLYIDQVVLSHFLGNMKWYEGDSKYNYEFAFKLKTNKNAAKSPIKAVEIRKVIFEEGAFNYADYNQKPFRKKGEKGIDFYRLQTTGINSVIDSISINNGFSAHLKSFSVREQSGFVLKNLSSNLLISDTSFVWNQSKLTSNKGDIDADIAFNFRSWKSWKYFNDSIEMVVDLRQSHVWFSDLAYFAPKIENAFGDLEISGNSKGHLANFRVNNLSISAGPNTYAKADVKFVGLPNFKNTFITADVSEAQLHLKELSNQLAIVDIPDELNKLGNLRFEGDFMGFLNDFVAKGKLYSSLGNVQSDIKVKLAENPSQNQYEGNLDLINFKLGEFVGDDNIGSVSFTSVINAKGNAQENLVANVKSNVSQFSYSGYTYKNVKIDGDIANRYFKGYLKSTDPNADLDVDGTIDYRLAAPKIDFKTNINNLALNALYLSKDTIVIKTVATMNFTGDQIENFVGEIRTKNLFININGIDYETGFTTVSGKLTDKGKLWTLSSDFATGSLETNFPLIDIGHSIVQHGIALLPKDMGFKKDDRHDYIKANLVLLNPQIINSMLPERIEISPNTQIDLLIDDDLGLLDLDFNANGFSVANMNFYQPKIELHKNGISLNGSSSFSKLEIDSFWISDYKLKIENDSRNMYFNHSGSINDSFVNFNILHSIGYSDSKSSPLHIDTFLFSLGQDTFQINSDSLVWNENNRFDFKNLTLSLKDDRIIANGFASLKNEYNIDYSIFNIDLEKIAPLLPTYFSVVKGEINGNGHLISKNGFPLVEASILVNPLSFRDMALESIEIESRYNDETNILGLSAILNGTNGEEVLKVNGGLSYKNNPTVDLFFTMNKVQNALFEGLAQGVVSNLNGTASGNIRINGSFAEPNLFGWLALDAASLHVDYLGTNYAFTDTFQIDRDNIFVKRLVLVDDFGNKGILNGKIQHNLMSKFDLDLAMSVKNFEILNIDEKDNDLYYGHFFGSGTAGFQGPLLRAEISCELSTEKGTKFYLPIQEDQGYSYESYIRFIDKESGATEYNVNDQDFSLDLNISFTADAETQLIFDKQLGDIIKATGSGRINMRLSPAGEFQMFGDYVINQGNYLFTAFDLINKRFEIEKGSKISWMGSPYDALISIRANYYLKANAYSLASGLPQFDQARLEQYKRNIPVVAYANLQGSLLHPEIKLNFAFIDEGSVDVASLQREIDNLQLSEEELTKQVVSLLVLNRFMPMYTSTPNNTDIFGSTVNAGLGDLISNQLTYWLSAISDDLQVNLNYQSDYVSDGVVLTQKELELALSTTFFNDRVSVNFAYELQNNYIPSTEIAYKVKPDGTVKVLVFQRQAQNQLISYKSNTIGFGVFLRREFDSFKDIFKKQDPKK